MARLRPPYVPDKSVPVLADGDLARLERACAGRSFQQRRDAAVIAVFAAARNFLSELAGNRYDPEHPNPRPPGLSLQGCLLHHGHPAEAKYPPFGVAAGIWRRRRR